MSDDTNNLAELIRGLPAERLGDLSGMFCSLAAYKRAGLSDNFEDTFGRVLNILSAPVPPPPATSPASEAGKATPDEFKAYVHHRLDLFGVPTHPDGPHSKEGCRIGDRLDIVFAENNRLVGTLSRLRELAEERREAYQRVAATGSAVDVWRMEGIEDEVFRILLSPAAPSAQAKPTREGEKVRELRKELKRLFRQTIRNDGSEIDIEGRGWDRAVAKAIIELDRLFPGVVAEEVKP